MPKDISMQQISHQTPAVFPPSLTPWSLRAWPPVLWQAEQTGELQLHHLGTHVTFPGDRTQGLSGQTLWGGHSLEGETGVAWDWIQIGRGVVAIADPLSLVTNLRLVGSEGEVLTAMEATLFLNELVHGLPWQFEVARALKAPSQ